MLCPNQKSGVGILPAIESSLKSRKLEAESRKLEAGSRKLEAGSWKSQAGSWKSQVASWKLTPRYLSNKLPLDLVQDQIA